MITIVCFDISKLNLAQTVCQQLRLKEAIILKVWKKVKAGAPLKILSASKFSYFLQGIFYEIRHLEHFRGLPVET